MSLESATLARVKPSATLATDQKARELKANGKDVKYDLEKTGYGWKTQQSFDPYVSALPTSCQMKRPPV